MSGGNVIIADQLPMTSRQKTFSVALSANMAPSAKIIVFAVLTSSYEVIADCLSFHVEGIESRDVSDTSS